MDFSLSTLSDAFRSAEYAAPRSDYCAYAFIIATDADTNVFPDLLLHYREIHELTGPIILVVSPRVEMGKAPGVPMDPIDAAEVLRKQAFYNYYTQETVDVGNRISDFRASQTLESMAFARFCGIPLSELPCLVFFSELVAPTDYVTWKLDGKTASDVIRDFRNIVSALEDTHGWVVEQRRRIREIDDAIDTNAARYERSRSALTADIEKLEAKIVVWQDKIEHPSEPAEIQGRVKKARMTRIQESRERIERLKSRLTEFASTLEVEQSDLKLKRAELLSDLETSTPVPALDIIQSLDRKRFRRQLIGKLTKAVPIVGSGLSGASIFS